MTDRTVKEARALAVVTGASSGIGRAFAREFARRGLDLLLTARRKDRLDALAGELGAGFGVKADVMQADLADAGQLKKVEDRIRASAQIEFLVNNAGFMTPETFTDMAIEEWDTMVRLHVLATVRLTHAALSGMIPRRRGNIINVASVAAFLPMTHNVTYCGTKAFLRVFTEALQMELHGTGVRVQVLCPGWTRTEMLEKPRVDTSHITEAWWGSPDRVVGYSLDRLRRGRLVCIPGWRNRALVRMCGSLPRPLLRLLLRVIRKNQVSMMER
jgi:short-subunit dehydrogenase